MLQEARYDAECRSAMALGREVVCTPEFNT